MAPSLSGTGKCVGMVAVLLSVVIVFGLGGALEGTPATPPATGGSQPTTVLVPPATVDTQHGDADVVAKPADAALAVPSTDRTAKADAAVAQLGPAPAERTPAELLAALRECPADSFQQDRAANHGAVAADLPPWELTDEIIDRTCAASGMQRRVKGTEPRLVYAIMFGLELDMLEVVLHEVAPVADVIFLTESSVTHSLGRKQLLFDGAKRERYAPFLHKIKHLVYQPVRAYKSGWDIERRQRNTFLRFLRRDANVTNGDVVLGNIDMDELFTRETLVRMKYCAFPDEVAMKVREGMTSVGLPFELVHFRYHTNCLQESSATVYHDTAFVFHDGLFRGKGIDLYARRRNNYRKPIAADKSTPVNPQQDVARALRRPYAAWHFTAFGGVDAVIAKYRNSPHRFVESVGRQAAARLIDGCEYQDRKRMRLPFWTDAAADAPSAKSSGAAIRDAPWWAAEVGSPARWPPVPLPYALTQRPCQFLARGWFR